MNAVSIRFIKGVGAKRAMAFARRQVDSVEDFFYFLPRRYEDRTSFMPVSELREGSEQTIKVKVLTSGERRSFRRRRFSITEALVEDASGRLSCVWFNQPYLKQYLKPQTELILHGMVQRYTGRLQMSNPEFELVGGPEDELLNTGRIVAVYPHVEGFGQRTLRRMMKQAIDTYLSQIVDPLPYPVRQRQKLLNIAKSVYNIHFPENSGMRDLAYTRLAFEEFFFFQLPLALRKIRHRQKEGISHQVDGPLVNEFKASLPFTLTASQEKVLGEIRQDMAAPQVMHRLLQGDVGSGKTVVAACACLMARQGGYQSVIMAPTELLARQHYAKLSGQLAGVRSRPVRLGLFTGSVSLKERQAAVQKIRDGEIDCVIGTHALLSGGLQFKSLGLVVIDEQHKFGVGQRALLPEKGRNPDVLIMTATPIPRTLAITLYGDLDISVISEMPPGRRPVKTLHYGCDDVPAAYDLAKDLMRKGEQVYIVFPVIEESLSLDIAGAVRMFGEFKAGEFREFRLGLIHGKLSQREQEKVMKEFIERRLDCLVSTTVLEVGIDVPSATCMIVQNAERFGLSQLHQLRGRVGRGSKQSWCLLVSDAQTEEAARRMEAMVKYTDGFRIAEQDLKIRGPGEYFGSRQHGISELKIGDPLSQMHLLKNAREEAMELVAADPGLESRQNAVLKERLLRRFPEYERLMVVG